MSCRRTTARPSSIEGLPNPEIAQMLHANLGTVKSRVHRARLFLRRRLTDYMGATLDAA